MPAEGSLRVVLCWHMHQPDYRDPETGTFLQPWVYLHAIKDYVDMAYHLEAGPVGAAAVVNFSSVLLEQLEAYRDALAARESRLPDPLLNVLQGDIPEDVIEREAIVRACFRAHRHRIVARFSRLEALIDYATHALAVSGGARFLSDQFIRELVIWYHIGWIGESARISDIRIARLTEKAESFNSVDACELLGLIAELIDGLLPRYRRLAAEGKIELSLTPGTHPMLPLLAGFESAREARPETPLPQRPYPGGYDRALAHIEEGIARFERVFGTRPAGCWPSEGGVSDATIAMLERYQFAWCATGENVLRNSLAKAGYADNPSAMHQGYRVANHAPTVFFRSDELSDLIGFSYATWHADDAIADLCTHLERHANSPGMDDAVVSIILDGENAWEHYPENGWHFLNSLYCRLAEHPRVKLTTFSKALGNDDRAIAVGSLPNLVSGSWVYGAFDTWIGHPDKNRAWELLVAAKLAIDTALPNLDAETKAQVHHQLAVCEGSDWFWWFGDDNPGETIASFDALYRRQLHGLYRLAGINPPDVLASPFTSGRSTNEVEAGGVMRRGSG
ncbi:MAG: glycoside hydrolase family 57 protein [Pseudomonadota bacterium]